MIQLIMLLSLNHFLHLDFRTLCSASENQPSSMGSSLGHRYHMLGQSKSQSLDLLSIYTCPLPLPRDPTWFYGFKHHLHADNNYIYIFSSDFYSGLKAHPIAFLIAVFKCLRHISNLMCTELNTWSSFPSSVNILPQSSLFQLTSTPSYLVHRPETLQLSFTPHWLPQIPSFYKSISLSFKIN